MTIRIYQLALGLANLLLPISLIVFATGFFPHKPFLTGLAQYQELQNAEIPAAPFDKVIFMVVDALRRYGPSPRRVCLTC